MLLRSKKLWAGLGAIVIAAIVVWIFFGGPWMHTQKVVGRFIEAPTRDLTDDEVSTLVRYVEETASGWVRPSADRQAELAKAAVRRALEIQEPFLFVEVCAAWRLSGKFPTVMTLIRDAIEREHDNCDILVKFFYRVQPKMIEELVDYQRVLTTSRHSALVLTAIDVLPPERLVHYRQACLTMLMREDVPMYCKSLLIARLNQQQVDLDWFADRAHILDTVIQAADAELRANINSIRQRKSPLKPGNP